MFVLAVLALSAVLLWSLVRFSRTTSIVPPRASKARVRKDSNPVCCRFPDHAAAERYLERRGYRRQSYGVWYLPSPTHRGTMAEVSYAGDREFEIEYWRLDGKKV